MSTDPASSAPSSRPPHGLPPLPLSQTETGALATAPLSTVVNSATDALYSDIYNLVHGEVKIVSVANNNAAGAGAVGGGEGDGAVSAPTSTNAAAASGPESYAASVEEKLTAAALGVDASTSAAPAPAPAAPANPNDALLETKKQRMANLSFAQRRHELARRLVQHSKSLAHVHALTAASLPKSHSAILQQKALKSHSPLVTSTRTAATIHDPPPRLGAAVQVASDALQFVKTGWVAQDEAQDALYFHHDGLWKARGHCHDVLGALCVLSTPMVGEGAKDDDAMEVDGDGKDAFVYKGGGGRWPDFPSDVALAVDRYETSMERAYSTPELQARLASAVRRKLVLGEVGAFGAAGKAEESRPLPWRVVLGKGGGSVRLTFGTPRTVSTAEALRQRSLAEGSLDDGANLEQYPMEARLSVLSESRDAPWKLLSVHVRCSPKTGESDHQLAMNRKQMFDLHRLGERAMLVEEAVCRKANEDRETMPKEESNKKKEEGDDAAMSDGDGQPQLPKIVPRPLHRLFEVTHAFALSLQMEILSSQAEALRRGAWGGGITSGGSVGRAARGGAVLSKCITVSSAHFFDQKGGDSDAGAANGKPAPIAVMAVHFWSCDDRYGPPRVGDLSPSDQEPEEENGSSSTGKNPNQRRDDNYLPQSDKRGEKRLSLCVRAVPTVGLVVSLSGASATPENATDKHMQRSVEKLLSSIQDPFQLSMSDALLAATVLCADRRCHAVVQALERQTETGRLPEWLSLEVECGTISVAARLSYPTAGDAPEARAPAVLFRLACDSRSGRFIPVFPRPASLLRLLACNDPKASDIQSLHSAALASASGASNASRRVNAASLQSTGRAVRDAFDALSRSMDTMGRKCGVGGEWNDIDTAHSPSLREKSIGQTCQDVRVSLMSSCGMAAIFGVGAIALKIVGGVDPLVDMAGGPVNDESDPDLVRVAPLGALMRQRMVEKVVKEGDGESKRIAQLRGELFALTARMNEEALAFVCFDVLTISESASSVPSRLEHAKIDLPEAALPGSKGRSKRPAKRARTTGAGEGSKSHHTLEEIEYATQWLDSVLRQ
ncbi:hypothetical protein ACHAXT_009383 [Thalassiosira profunda]